MAASRNDYEAVRILLDHGANIDALTPYNSFAGTALAAACRAGNVRIVHQLLDRHADPNVDGGSYDASPLCASVESQCLECAEALLEAGLSLDPKRSAALSAIPRAIGVVDKPFLILLMNAWSATYSDMLAPVLGLPPDGLTASEIEAVCDDLTENSLTSTINDHIRQSDRRVVAILLPLRHSGLPASPLHAAISLGSPDAVRLLLTSGANVDVKGYRESTPLMAAIENCDPSIVDILLRFGASPQAQDSNGWLPIHHLAATPSNVSQDSSPHCFEDILTLLVSHGADINGHDDSGSTLLHLVTRRLHAASEVRAILTRGASVDAQDNSGQTPLHISAMSGTTEVARVLIQFGASTTLRDRQGRTAGETALAFDQYDALRDIL